MLASKAVNRQRGGRCWRYAQWKSIERSRLGAILLEKGVPSCQFALGRGEECIKLFVRSVAVWLCSHCRRWVSGGTVADWERILLTQDSHNGKMSFGFAVLSLIPCVDRCAADTRDSFAVTFTSCARRFDVVSTDMRVFDGFLDASLALHAHPVTGRVHWVQKQMQRLICSASFAKHAIRVSAVEGGLVAHVSTRGDVSIAGYVDSQCRAEKKVDLSLLLPVD